MEIVKKARLSRTTYLSDHFPQNFGCYSYIVLKDFRKKTSPTSLDRKILAQNEGTERIDGEIDEMGTSQRNEF
jgi:hypothetical protein